MGLLDAVKDKLSNIPIYTKPLTDASKALDGAAPIPAPQVDAAAAARNEAVAVGEAARKAAEPIPRAKGGRVKAGGAKMPMSGPRVKNVDNSGLKKEPC